MRIGILGQWVSCLALAFALGACGGGDDTTPPAPTFTIGGTVTGLASGESVTLANNGANPTTVTANTSFVFSTRIAEHGSYSVTVTMQPTGQTCTVSSGSGSSVTENVTSVAVTCANLAQYAYVVNYGSNTVSQFSIGSSGMLAPLTAATVATGRSPESVTVDPTHRYVYVTNFSDNTVSQYVIQQDGTLLPNSPATVATGHGPWAMAVSPSGDWAYVVNSADNTISQYIVNSSGALIASSTAPVATGLGPWNLTLSPNGEYAYVSSHGNLTTSGITVSQYAVDSGSGAITPLNPPTIPSKAPNPTGIAVDGSSSYAYVANINANSVSQYSIGTGGTLTNLTPSSVITGTDPVYVAIDPSNRYAYVANYTIDSSPGTAGTISQYTLQSTGALAPMAVPSVAAGAGPAWIAFDAFGQYAYVVNIGSGTSPGTVSIYSIGAGGGLTLIGTVNVGLSPHAIATA
jgi:6-phosphogluconolactonase (cycloisomerase 2 family)